MDFTSKMTINCVSFCLERPGVGIYHSEFELWCDISEEFQIDGFPDVGYFQVIELSRRMFPFATIGGRRHTFMQERYEVEYEWSDGDSDSLLHLFLANKLIH